LNEAAILTTDSIIRQSITVTPEAKCVSNTPGKAILPYDPSQEPYLDHQGLEGTVKWEQGYAIRALVRAYKYERDREALDLLHSLMRFDLKPGIWENTTLEGYKVMSTGESGTYP
jgi:hypothetical protein